MGKSTERRDKNFDKAFSERLTEALPDRRISECAEKTGVNQATLHRWRIEPPRALVDIKRIAEYCHVSAGELAFGESSLSAEDETFLEMVYLNPPLQTIMDALATAALHDAAMRARLSALPQKKVVADALINLKDHLATLVRESKEYQACLSAAVLLDQVYALLPEESKLGLPLVASLKKKEVIQGQLPL